MKKQPLDFISAIDVEGTPDGWQYLASGWSQLVHSDGRVIAGYFSRHEAKNLAKMVQGRNDLLATTQRIEGLLAADWQGDHLALQHMIANAKTVLGNAFQLHLECDPRLFVEEGDHVHDGKKKTVRMATLVNGEGFLCSGVMNLDDAYLLAGATRELDDLITVLGNAVEALETDWAHDFHKLEQMAVDALAWVRAVQEADFDIEAYRDEEKFAAPTL